jgi:hypothetical protein
MNDGLGYIREAVSKKGPSAQVEVIRWERDFKTGYYSKPFKVEVKADVALRELETPMHKRSRVWRFIRPIGMTMDGNISAPQPSNLLNDPELIEQLKAELRAELMAQMQTSNAVPTPVQAKPKRTRQPKKVAIITEEQPLDITQA